MYQGLFSLSIFWHCCTNPQMRLRSLVKLSIGIKVKFDVFVCRLLVILWHTLSLLTSILHIIVPVL